MRETTSLHESTADTVTEQGLLELIEKDHLHRPPVERPGLEQRIRASLTPEHGVAWVRVSELINTGTGRIAGRGIDLESELARRLRHPGLKGPPTVNRRSSLPPLDAFGRSTSMPARELLARR